MVLRFYGKIVNPWCVTSSWVNLSGHSWWSDAVIKQFSSLLTWTSPFQYWVELFLKRILTSHELHKIWKGGGNYKNNFFWTGYVTWVVCENREKGKEMFKYAEKNKWACRRYLCLGWPVGFLPILVSASDVTPTKCWLNVWCIWHTKVETLQEFRSHRRIGWIIQDFRETCVSCSLTFHLETKMLWRQTPSRKKKAVVFTNVTTSAYQDRRWIFKSMWNI